MLNQNKEWVQQTVQSLVAQTVHTTSKNGSKPSVSNQSMKTSCRWNVDTIVCGCTQQPFRLFMFPSELKNGERRKQWITLTKRETLKKTPWTPKPSDRVCSEHFVDKIPTPENPFPSLKLGYTTEEKPKSCLLYTSPSPRDATLSRMPSSA